jgi:DNA polymerase-3 subunit delta
VLARLENDLLKGWKPGLTLLTGEDRYHLDAAQKALLDYLAPKDSSELALTVLSEGPVKIDDVVAAARTVPMFTDRRVVFVREVEILEGEPDALLDYAKAPPGDSYLLIRAPKLDTRRKLHKALIKAALVVELSPPKDARAAAEAATRAALEMGKQRGLELDRNVAAFLGDVSSGDLYRVGSELDKLDVWIGGSGTRRVRLEDAREIVFGGGTLSGWEIANAVQQRDLRGALESVRRLVSAGEEPLRLIGGLAWRARVLLQAKAMVAGGTPPQRALAAVRAWPKDEFARGLSRYSLTELMAFPGRLLAADRCLKSRKLDPLVVMESLVRDLIGPPASGAGG